VGLFEWQVAVRCQSHKRAQEVALRLTAYLTTIQKPTSVVTRWDEKAGLRRDAVRSQVIDALEEQEIKETGNAED
jgi:hypothetical protein